MPTQSDWQHMWNIIYSKTGWDYQEAKKRIFFIGHHMSQSPELGFEGSLPLQLSRANENVLPTGFFVSNRYRGRQRLIDPKNWLLEQNLPQEIRSGIEKKEIEVDENISTEILVLPYRIKDLQKYPLAFQNTGQGYSFSEMDLLLGKFPSEGVFRDGSNIIFKWNECRDKNSYCNTGAVVSAKKIDIDQLEITVKVIGVSLSQITPWISPNWTEAWINPRLIVKCNQIESNFLLATYLGFTREHNFGKISPFFQGNNSILAPLEKKAMVFCKSKNIEIELSTQETLVEKINSVEHLPGRRLTYELHLE